VNAFVVVLAGALLAATQATAAVRGVVLSGDGKPVAHAQVSAYAVEDSLDRMARILAGRARPSIAKTTSADDGSFTLDANGFGVIDVGVTAPDFVPLFGAAVLGDDDVMLELSRPRPSEWRVRSAAGPQRGARAIVMTVDGEYETTSDATGAFSISIPEGVAELMIVADGFNPAVVSPSMPNVSHEIVLDRGAMLHGEVVGPDGSAVVSARISINNIPMATTAANGTFTVAHAPQNPYLIEADAGNLGGSVAGASTPMRIVAHRRVALTGVVRDAQKHPLRGLAIAAVPERSNAWERGGITDENGAFTLHVAPAKYALMLDGQYRAHDSIDVPKPLVHDVVATRAPLLAGVVRLQDGTPVAGAHVGIAFDMPANAEAMTVFEAMPELPGTMTNRNGRFRLLSPNFESQVRLMATKEGLPPAETEPLTAKDQQARGDIVMVVPKTIDVPLRVTDAAGKPIAGVAVRVSHAGRRGGRAIETGTDGTATLHLADGTWRIALAKQGYSPKAIENVRIDAPARPLVAQLDAAVAVRGRVVRNDGSGAGEIMLSLNDGNFAESSPDGSFVFPSVAAGPYMLRYFTANGIDGSLAVNAPVDDVRIVIPEGGDVRGRVTDASGAPVSNFRISIAPAEGFVEPRAVSDADGHFEWKGAPAGPARVSVSATGFASATKEITVAADKLLEGVTIVLTRGRTLRGKVTNASGEPLADVSVNLEVRGSTMREDASAITTRDDGSYEATGLGSDAAIARFAKEGFAPLRRSVAAGDGDTRLDVQLTAGRTVTGHVVTADGKPVTQAHVSAQSAAAGSEAEGDTTHEDGSFTIEGLLPARYDFVAMADSEGRLADVDVSKVSDITIRMPAPTHATISGSVVGAGDARMITVMVTSATSTASAQADSTGKFRIENAPTGIVKVNAIAFTTKPRYTNEATLDVSANSDTHVDLTFPEQFAISGHVTANQSPLAGAAVTLSRMNGESVRAATRDDGSYDATLSAGRYTIDVQAAAVPGGYHAEREIGGPSTVDIAIDVNRIVVTVLDSVSDAPIAGAAVSTREAGMETHTASRGTTAANGQLAISVPRETTQVVVEKNGYATVIVDSISPQITIRMARTDGAVVRLIDARDGRTLTGIAIARDAAGRVIASANEAEPDGTMRLPLLPGTYRFSASANEYGSQTVRADVPGAEVRIVLPRGGKLLLQSRTTLSATARLIEPNGEEYVRCWCSGIAEIKLDGRTTLVDSIAPGSYALEIVAPGAKPRHIPVSVIEGETTPVNADP